MRAFVTNIELNNVTNFDNEKILKYLKNILQETFPKEKEKQEILIYDNRINFSCPICKDSNKSSHKKRGNIYNNYNKNMYKCFNCGASMDIEKFFKIFHKNEIFLGLSDIKLFSENNYKYFENNNYQFPKLEDFLQKYNLKNIFGPKLLYLKARGIENFNNFYTDEKSEKIYILDLIKRNSQIFVKNAIVRQFKEPKYLKINFELPKLEPPKNFFGIQNCNFNKKVFLLEGSIDSLLLDNSFAILGLHNNIDSLKPVKENIILFFDNDTAGRKKSEKYLKEGWNVFLWKKFLKDYKFNKFVKDYNDIYIQNKNIDYKKLLNYYSNNVLDLIYL
jgi:transcription elongation factor Elf1/5S rRNA maturation endonuclease (ribonuclease M5)